MKKYFRVMLALLLLALIFPVYGQDGESDADSGLTASSQNPVKGEKVSRAVRSFSDAIASSVLNRIGFSLSAVEGSFSDFSPNPIENNSSGITDFSSSVFANFGRRNSRLHLDYGAGYRIYSGQQDKHIVDQNFNVTYTYAYQITRKLKFQLSDILSSSLNDPFSSRIPSLGTTINWNPSPSSDVLFLPQRITLNQAKAQIDFESTRSTHFSVFGSYNNYWYEKQIFGDINAVQIGAGVDRRITKWLSLASSYSAYLNSVDESLRDSQIHRLEIGRFRFLLSRNVEVGNAVSSILVLGSQATLLFTLGDISDVFVRGKVDQADIGKVYLTQPTRITVESFRDKKFDGKVYQISPLGVEKENVTTFEVKVSIANPGRELKAQMSANAEIILEEKKNVLLVPESAVVYDRQRNTSLEVPDLANEKGRRQVSAKLGISNGVKTELVSGLKEGAKVILQ